MFSGATVMDTQILVKSVGGTLIVPVTMRGMYRGTAVSSVLIQASSRRSLLVTTHATVAAMELMEIHQSAKVYVYQRPFSVVDKGSHDIYNFFFNDIELCQSLSALVRG